MGHIRRIGTRIREERTERGLSQAKLARKAGVSTGHLLAVENSKSSMENGPGIYFVAAVAGALGMTVSDLIGETKPKMSPLEYKVWRAVCELRAMQ